MYTTKVTLTPTCLSGVDSTTPHPDSTADAVVILPRDKLTSTFCINRKFYTYQYPTRNDFCSNILSMQNRSCVHVVSDQKFDKSKLESILEKTSGMRENIVYYGWKSCLNADESELGHVFVIYIDKAQKRIYFMPDMELDIEGGPSALVNKYTELRELGYTPCFPVGVFFRRQHTVQNDGYSCSFMAHQFAQKLEHMNSSDVNPGQIPLIENPGSFFDEISLSGFKFQPFYSPDGTPSQSEDDVFPLEQVDLIQLFSKASVYVLPREFYGIFQRVQPLLLNDHFFQNELSSGAQQPIYSRSAQKSLSKALWDYYFEFGSKHFEPQYSHVPKHEKTVEKLLSHGKTGYQSDYEKKTSHIRGLYNIAILINRQHKETAIQIATDIYRACDVLPRDVFFKNIGADSEEERMQILEKITEQAHETDLSASEISHDDTNASPESFQWVEYNPNEEATHIPW